MVRVLLWTAGVVLALLGVFAGVVAMQPNRFTVQREATIPAPPQKVFVKVNNFRAWEEWSPWAKLDPNAKATFEGPEAGEGAIFRWSGNSDIGEGNMTIVESVPGEKVRIKLVFIRPMAGECENIFTFTPIPEGGTRITWTMTGENDFMGKAMCLFMSMDKVLGAEFEKGLNSLREVTASK
jgi:uncharacterized protein YndB with AHSA1/START domain